MDPFGYSAERHEARALVETYEGAVRDMPGGLSPRKLSAGLLPPAGRR